MALIQTGTVTTGAMADATPSSFTIAHNTTDLDSSGNRLLVVRVVVLSVGNISSVSSDVDGAFTLLQAFDGGDGTSVEIWYLKNPTAGAHTITVTADATNRRAGGGAVTYGNVDQTTPFGTPATASGTSTTPSVTVSSASGEIVLDIMVSKNSAGGTTPTVDASQTQQFNFKTVTGLGMSSRLNCAGSREAGAASVSMDWTLSDSQGWGMIGVAIKETGGGGGGGGAEKAMIHHLQTLGAL